MDILHDIICNMSTEEVRGFKLFMLRNRDYIDRKDQRLFDSMRKLGEKYSEEKIHQSLYGNDDKNTFYRLKNRLFTELNKSLLVQHFDDDETNYSFHLLSLHSFFYKRNRIKAAIYYLKKAEIAAIASGNAELLDMVYTQSIKMSGDIPDRNPHEIIEARKKNQKTMQQLRELDDVLAVVKYRMKLTQNFSSGKNPVIEILQKTVKEFSSDQNVLQNTALRFKLYESISQILLQQHQYDALLQYLLQAYKDFERDKLFSKNNHETKIQMLIYIVNASFKTGNYKGSLDYAEQLKDALSEFGKIQYDKYIFFWYNAQVINYSVLDKHKGIIVLLDMKQNKKIVSTPYYEMFVYLNLSIFYFDIKDFHSAIKNLQKLYLLKGYVNADDSLQLKIGVFEMMIRFELADEDTFIYAYNQLQKKFRLVLDNRENKLEKTFLKIISVMNQTGEANKSTKKIIQQFLQRPSSMDEAGIVKYSAWLKDKI